jgi:chromosome segregation ATPase
VCVCVCANVYVLAAVERVLSLRELAHAGEVVSWEQAAHSLQERLQAYDASVMSTIPAVRSAAAHWQGTETVLRDQLRHLSAREQQLQNEALTCQEQLAQAAVTAASLRRRAEEGESMLEISSARCNSLASTLLAEQQKSLDLQVQVASVKETAGKEKTLLEEEVASAQESARAAEQLAWEQAEKARMERERGNQCLSNAEKLDAVLQGLKAELDAQDRDFRLLSTWLNWQLTRAINAREDAAQALELLRSACLEDVEDASSLLEEERRRRKDLHLQSEALVERAQQLSHALQAKTSELEEALVQHADERRCWVIERGRLHEQQCTASTRIEEMDKALASLEAVTKTCSRQLTIKISQIECLEAAQASATRETHGLEQRLAYAQEDRKSLVVERDALLRQNNSIKGSLSNLEWQLSNCFSSAATAVDQLARVREVCE